jgi:hypothetical protein
MVHQHTSKEQRPAGNTGRVQVSADHDLEKNADHFAQHLAANGQIAGNAGSSLGMVKPASAAELQSSMVSAHPQVKDQLTASKGSGEKLPSHIRQKAGGAWGAVAKEIRIHTDSRAAEMNRALGSHAFAYGSDLYFGAGKYEPYTSKGEELLLHELAHAFQQQSVGNAMIQRSAIVEQGAKGPVVKAHIYYYGNEATESVAKAATNEINTMWNEPEGKVDVGGKEYTVKFDIKYSVVDEDTAHAKAQGNTDPLNNFVRIEKDKNKYNGVQKNRSWMEFNYGHWLTADNLGSSTTAAHEFGHGLGLNHTPADMKGKGQPGIMANRGVLVDAEYTYDPKQGDSRTEYNEDTKKFENKNTINPAKRKVLQSDIDNVKNNAKADHTGKISINVAVNKMLDVMGNGVPNKNDK